MTAPISAQHSPVSSGRIDGAAYDPLLARWLFVVAAMVFGAVVIGGLTRLTESGLSITDWRPLTGWLPPFGENAWRAVFERYKQIPEYRELNAGMSLAEFKGIFWLEYVHRLWGRMIGLVFALPFAWFLVTKRIDRQVFPILVGLFLLGGVQGGIGWYMVQSGLAERLDVSQYRLALHLGVALLIYVLTLRTAFWLRRGRAAPSVNHAGWRQAFWLVLAVVGVTIVSGAFVAGLNAGLTYNTFPMMDGQLVPDFIYTMSPAWLSMFEDIATVQFNHRLLAIVSLALVFALLIASLRPGVAPAIRFATILSAAAATAQAVLGIATLLSVVRIELAVVHQSGAVILITVLVWGIDRLERSDERPPAYG